MTAPLVALPAGRDLDALVAEKVMGWAISTTWKDRYRVVSGVTLIDQPVPLYSTDIAAAWEVVENLDLRGYAIRLENVGPLIGAAFFHRKARYVYNEMENAVRGYGETAPLAICRAALKAVGA